MSVVGVSIGVAALAIAVSIALRTGDEPGPGDSGTGTTSSGTQIVDVLNIRVEVPAPWLVVTRAKDQWVWDADGNQYLDFFAGILTTMTGYKVPEVVSAIKAQADKMLHTSTLYLIENQIDLAEKIADLSGIPDAKVFFTNSGTEANDAAA